MPIQFGDISFVTANVPRLRAFYEAVFGGRAEGDDYHGGLAVGGTHFTFVDVAALRESSAFHYVSSGGANNVIFSFGVDNVDAEYQRLLSLGTEMLNQPTTHPWGARSFQFKDPDGNVLNFRRRPQ
ncbi:MAG: VOC family protein [Phycisphaerae bacterium]|nr:VOC family protein [Phycisphaerae bacterium]